MVVREFATKANGGISFYVRYLSKALSDLGNKVYLICSKEASDSSSEIPSSIEDIVRVKSIPAVPKQVSFNLSARKIVSKMAEQWSIDIIHYNSPGKWLEKENVTEIYTAHMAFPKNISLISSIVGEKKGVKYTALSRIYKTYAQTIAQYLEASVLKSVDGIIFVSELVDQEMKEMYKLKKETTIIPNGIDPHRFAAEGRDRSADRYVLHVGGTRVKGVDMLINAWGKYNGVIDNLKIVGGIENQEDYTRAKSIDSIDLLGRVSDEHLVELYRNAEALIHPARYEPFGMVIFEAAACGTPSLTSEKTVGATKYLPNKFKFRTQCEGPESIVKGIKEIEEKNRKISQKCVGVFVEDNTWERVAKEITDFAIRLE